MGDESTTGGSAVPSASAATGYGVTMTFVGAVLLALGYYGLQAFEAGREVGDALPEPVYVFVLALFFVIELLNSRLLGLYALGRAVAVTVLYGTLFVVGIEGAVYLWANPDVVLDDYAGLTVLAGALVVAALVYVGYLTVVDSGG